MFRTALRNVFSHKARLLMTVLAVMLVRWSLRREESVRAAEQVVGGNIAHVTRLMTTAIALAGLLAGSDPAEAAGALERAILIHPFDPEPHARLAELAAALGRPALEVRERRALVALRPVDRAGALYRLAVAQRRAGDATGARRSVLAALEIAPGYAEAQDLLLELAGGGR